MPLKYASWCAVAVVVAGLAGWVWGASGRSEAELARQAAQQAADLSEARACILEGQVQIFLTNFGAASQRYEAARAAIERVQRAFRASGQSERAGRFEASLTHLREAQRLAVSLDSSARNAADEALRALAEGRD